MNRQFDVMEMIDMLMKRWWIWALSAIVLASVTFVYTEVFVDPLYRSDGTLYVSAQKIMGNDVSTGYLNASQDLVFTYKEILMRRTVLSQVAADLDNRYSVNNLKGMISMNAVADTGILEVKVTGKVPDDVYEICRSILSHAPDALMNIVEAGAVKIVDDSQMPLYPISPDVRKNTVIAFLLGMIIGGAIIIALGLFDTRIKSREDIINRYPEPLLGEIPEVVTRKAGVDK